MAFGRSSTLRSTQHGVPSGHGVSRVTTSSPPCRERHAPREPLTADANTTAVRALAVARIAAVTSYSGCHLLQWGDHEWGVDVQQDQSRLGPDLRRAQALPPREADRLRR